MSQRLEPALKDLIVDLIGYTLLVFGLPLIAYLMIGL